MHWVSIAFLVALLASGITPVTKWGFGVLTALWAVGFGAYGLMASPGPALSGWLRKTFIPAHIALSILPAIVAVMVLKAEPGPLPDHIQLMIMVTLAAGTAHGMFHIWRHTSLRDGALRNITPRFLHPFL